MKVSVVSYSVSDQPTTLREWEIEIATEIRVLYEEGAKIILYPEYFLMGLADYFPGGAEEQYQRISVYTSTILLPKLSEMLKGKDLFLCLGTGPREFEGKLFNSSPVWTADTWMFQDKIHLTPWEVDFTAGTQLNYFRFHELKVSCLICYDIEQPGIGLSLKRSGVDLVLVPSATTNRNGNQRVNRCASARSVELGAVVVTCPLIGTSTCELIDFDEGRQGFFLPAQEVVNVEQEQYSAYSTVDHIINHYELDEKMLKALKIKDEETKPYFSEDLIYS